MIITRRKLIICLVLFILALGLIFVWQKSGRIIEIGSQLAGQAGYVSDIEISGAGISPLSGLACQNYQRRPLAVVLAEDPVARPLSGISEADLVFEMPVITGSITRLIAFYVCDSSKEIGSLRSARHDFIPLAMGLDAILAHWGGSHFALDELNAGVMDNIDALKNPYNAFYQKRGIPQPHNGFTSMERLLNSANKLGYRLENNFEGYPFQKITNPKSQITNYKQILKIEYSWPYNVEYQYNPDTNSYLRWRAGKPEIDKSNSKQIEAKNIVVMRAFSRQIEGPDYNDLDIEGTGKCQVYQNGTVIPCVWQKDASNPASKLYFLDKASDKEIPFVPGQTWIQIVEPGQEVSWE